ncbi:amidohydrolase family protein [Ramlibacter sp.]|uniref:amidohydrolase family protein n=1 Tax=Ramlibacter sp. TaxID=1917967 RepID=UPI003D1277C7
MQASTGPQRPTRRPHFALPRGSTDCHAHLFGPVARYPYAPDRLYSPVESTAQDYVHMLDTLGLDRAVLVQGSAQGTDNRILLDAIAAYPERLRGIAVVRKDVDDEELQELNRGGIRGIRMSDTLNPAVSLSRVAEFGARVKPLGWHLQLHLGRAEDLLALRESIERSPVPILLDHMASAFSHDAIDGTGVQTMLALSRLPHVWVKIAAYYRRSEAGPPYDDMAPLVHALLDACPDRLVWGSNWPHPVHNRPVPDDTDLLEAFGGWVADAALRDRILVDNPQRLFGFPPVAA